MTYTGSISSNSNRQYYTDSRNSNTQSLSVNSVYDQDTSIWNSSAIPNYWNNIDTSLASMDTTSIPYTSSSSSSSDSVDPGSDDAFFNNIDKSTKNIMQNWPPVKPVSIESQGASPSSSGGAGANSGSNYQKALNFVLKWEGGYVNNPADPGGATNKGITQGTYDSWLSSKGLPSKSVAQITDQEVNDIYYNNYWKAAGCDKISDPKLAEAVFNTSVNMGPGAAKELLAQSGNDPKTYVNLVEQRYKAIGNPVFLQGWLNRTNALRQDIGVA